MLLCYAIVFLFAYCANGAPFNPEKNPEINPNLFQGDILGIDPKMFENPELYDDRGIAASPNILQRKWPRGIVPYTIDPIYNATHRATIFSGMKYLEDSVMVNGKYCIKFVPRTIEENWVSVVPADGCSSLVGLDPRFAGVGQSLTLQIPGCLVNAIVAHEFMHALGFFHEQSRPDRDDFVTVNLQNVDLIYRANFIKLNENQVDYLDLPYDYDSVMHYGPKDFSNNGEATIVPKDSHAVIGQRKYLSSNDILEIQRYYGCVEYKSNNN